MIAWLDCFVHDFSFLIFVYFTTLVQGYHIYTIEISHISIGTLVVSVEGFGHKLLVLYWGHILDIVFEYFGNFLESKKAQIYSNGKGK